MAVRFRGQTLCNDDRDHTVRQQHQKGMLRLGREEAGCLPCIQCDMTLGGKLRCRPSRKQSFVFRRDFCQHCRSQRYCLKPDEQQTGDNQWFDRQQPKSTARTNFMQTPDAAQRHCQRDQSPMSPRFATAHDEWKDDDQSHKDGIRRQQQFRSLGECQPRPRIEADELRNSR